MRQFRSNRQVVSCKVVGSIFSSRAKISKPKICGPIVSWPKVNFPLCTELLLSRGKAVSESPES